MRSADEGNPQARLSACQRNQPDCEALIFQTRNLWSEAEKLFLPLRKPYSVFSKHWKARTLASDS
jgi:hypothetical protein